MRAMVRRFAPVAAFVLAAGGGLTVAAAGPAAAGDWGCSGGEVSGSPYAVTTDSGAVWAYTHLYYDSSNGQNCAVTVKTGSYYGQSTYTLVNLIECVQDAPGGGCTEITHMSDPSNMPAYYKYYAGPVTVNGRGHCVALVGMVQDSAGTIASFSSNGGFHCG